MNIMHVCPPWIDTPPKTYGGTEWVIYNLADQFIQMGHQVTLFATQKSQTAAHLEYVFSDSLFEQGITDMSLALPSLLHYDQAIKYANSHHFDLVHFHLSSDTDLMLLKFMHDLNKPYLATAHTPFPYDFKSGMDQAYLNHYGHGQPIISLSRAMEALVPEQLKKFGYVHNSVDTVGLKYNPQPQGWEGQPYLTWLGKIVPWKGVEEAIKTAKAAQMRFVFAGVISDHDTKVQQYYQGKSYFQEVIEPYIDNDSVIYVGPADLALKNQLLGNASGFLNPIAWDEPFGLVSLEAMACGTPVISYARGAIPEVIVNGQTGLLVNQLSQMIEAVPQLSQLHRQDCRDHVEQRFSARVMAHNYLNRYQRLLSQLSTGFAAPIESLPSASSSVVN